MRKRKPSKRHPRDGKVYAYDEERLFRFLSLRIKHLVARGYSQMEIAGMAGVDAGVVSRLKNMVWRTNRKPADQNAIQRLWTDGLGIPPYAYISFIWNTHEGWDEEPAGEGDYLVTDGNGEFDTAIWAREKWLGLLPGTEVKYVIPVVDPGRESNDGQQAATAA